MLKGKTQVSTSSELQTQETQAAPLLGSVTLSTSLNLSEHQPPQGDALGGH